MSFKDTENNSGWESTDWKEGVEDRDELVEDKSGHPYEQDGT